MGKPYWMNDDQYDAVTGKDTADVHADCKRKLEQARAAYDGACKLVAEMHAAAVGAVTGPKVGVVEDVAAVRVQRDKLLHAVRSASSSLSQSPTYEVPPIVVRDVADRLQAVNQELNLP